MTLITVIFKNFLNLSNYLKTHIPIRKNILPNWPDTAFHFINCRNLLTLNQQYYFQQQHHHLAFIYNHNDKTVVIHIFYWLVPYHQRVIEKMTQKSNGNSSTRAKRKGGSIRSIFIHADGFDLWLMVLGLIGSVGSGFTIPAGFLITSYLVNTVGGASTLSQDLFLKNINKVSVFYSIKGIH